MFSFFFSSFISPSPGSSLSCVVAMDCEMVGVGEYGPLSCCFLFFFSCLSSLSHIFSVCVFHVLLPSSSGARSALARCSIVNYNGEVLYDKFVKPKEPVTGLISHRRAILLLLLSLFSENFCLFFVRLSHTRQRHYSGAPQLSLCNYL
jgi:hypothetical protein